MESIILTQGVSVHELLNSVRNIIRDEISAIPAPTKQKPFLSLPEASAFLGLSKSTIYRMTSAKEIPHIKRGGKILFNTTELTTWVQSARVRTNS